MDKIHARNLIEDYMFREGLIQKGWRFKFSNHKTSAGVCYDWKKLIVLSGYYVENNTNSEIINTMLHEIGHALAPEKEHHGKIWRKIFRDLLIKYDRPVIVNRCYDSQVINMPKGKWLLYCDNCNKSWERHNRRWWFKHTDDTGYLSKVKCHCKKYRLKIKKQF
tara:strand:+ start:13561 stop:14052 length:492 start_codon:yes stop_codon:yes gene_type:complete